MHQSIIRIAEVVPKSGNSSIQSNVIEELVIDLKKSKHRFNSISVDTKELELVVHAKILGLSITSNVK